MAKTTQKLILSLDTQSQTYKPAGHNLTSEQAIDQVGRLQGDGITTLIIDQDHHHRALSFHQCKPCQKAAEEATNKRNQASEQQQPAAAVVSEEAAEEE